MMRRGLRVEKTIGIGDAVQFTSLPENYFRHTGQKLVDVEKHWVFDHNPYVDRENEPHPDLVFKIWNHRPFIPNKPAEHMSPSEARSRVSTFLSNAEIHANLYDVPVVLNRPRLYKYEEFEFSTRTLVLLHTHGRSHGAMPDHVIEHVLRKYKRMQLVHIGLPSDIDLGIPRINTPTLWSLAQLISQARMFIGIDSGPSWIAACYPDVVLKKIRTKPIAERFKDWVPLDFENNHSHWDDRCAQIFNPSEDDIGFTYSYRRI